MTDDYLMRLKLKSRFVAYAPIKKRPQEEAIYIIDRLLKNKSEIQPNTLHTTTQGQTTTVFAG